VSTTSTADSKEQVRQATDIVELVGQYLTLSREGRNYKALCPWHDDTNPSLHVNPERQSWKCWVCDIGGDVFSFIMHREGITFPEALAMLADRAGIPLKPTSSSRLAADSKKNLYDVAAWAEAELHRCLTSDPLGEPARNYLQQRGVTAESIRHFHLGFAPNEWDWLVRRAKDSEISLSNLIKIGLLATSSRTGRHYDRFKGRVLFSIRDTQNRPIAMGGRILPEFEDQKTAKYINTPETPLFSKSNQLYGLDLARDTISARNKIRHAIVMEGYTDCVIAHQFGFHESLAVLGTALGDRHVRLLSRYADRVTLVLDGDAAGKKRANEILNLFIAGQLDLRVLTLPDGLDPCDFILQRGADAFREQLDVALDALDHKLRVATEGVQMDSGSHEANRALEEILATLAQAPPLRTGGQIETKLREDQFLARLAREFHVPEETVRGRMVALRKSARRFAPQRGGDPLNAPLRINDPWERELMEIILQEPEAISRVVESIGPDPLADPVCRQIFSRLCELSSAGESPDFGRLVLEFDDPAMKNLLVQLDEGGRDRGGSDLAKQLPDLLLSFQLRNEKRNHQQTTAALKEKRFDEQREVEILQDLVEQQRSRQREE
jgi:DNA primase